jgi:hypothetical protein
LSTTIYNRAIILLAVQSNQPVSVLEMQRDMVRLNRFPLRLLNTPTTTLLWMMCHPMGRRNTAGDVVALMFRPEFTPPTYYLVMGAAQQSWIPIFKGIQKRLQKMTDCMKTLTLHIPPEPHASRSKTLDGVFGIRDMRNKLHEYDTSVERVVLPVSQLTEWYQNLCGLWSMASIIKVIHIKGAPPATPSHQTGMPCEGWDMFESVHTVHMDNAALSDIDANNLTLFRHVYTPTCLQPLLSLFGRGKPIRNIVFEPTSDENITRTMPSNQARRMQTVRTRILQSLSTNECTMDMYQCASSAE